MEPQDVLADHMHGRRPTALLETIQVHRLPVIQQGGEVAQQSIKPDVENLPSLNQMEWGNITGSAIDKLETAWKSMIDFFK